MVSFDPALVSTELVGEGRHAWRVCYAGFDVSNVRAEFHSLLYNRRVSLSEAVGRRVDHRGQWRKGVLVPPETLVAEDVQDWWDGQPAHRRLEILAGSEMCHSRQVDLPGPDERRWTGRGPADKDAMK